MDFGFRVQSLGFRDTVTVRGNDLDYRILRGILTPGLWKLSYGDCEDSTDLWCDSRGANFQKLPSGSAKSIWHM